jgi:hypothetical protein
VPVSGSHGGLPLMLRSAWRGIMTHILFVGLVRIGFHGQFSLRSKIVSKMGSWINEPKSI